MSRSSKPFIVRPGVTDDGYIGIEIGALGGSTGVYIGPEFEFSVESASPLGHRIQWLHADHDVELGTPVGGEKEYQLQVHTTHFLRQLERGVDGDTEIVSEGFVQNTDFRYVTENASEINWSTGLSPLQSSLEQLVGSTGGEIESGIDREIVRIAQALDDAALALSENVPASELHVATVSDPGGAHYVLTYNQPVEGDGYSPWAPDYETLYFEDGTRMHRAVGGSVTGDNFLMRPAAVDQFRSPGTGPLDDGSGGTFGSEVDEEWGLPLGSGEHPAGPAAYTTDLPGSAEHGGVPPADRGTDKVGLRGNGSDASAANLSTESDSTYVVQAGDTLSEIAAAAGVSAQDLAEINGIENVDHIEAGSSLYIPVATPSGDTGSAPTSVGNSDVTEPEVESSEGEGADPAAELESTRPGTGASLSADSFGASAGQPMGGHEFAPAPARASAVGVLSGLESVLSSERSGDAVGMLYGGAQLVSELDGSHYSALDGFAADLGAVTGPASDPTAGADTFVAGSAIFGRSDYTRTIRDMRAAITSATA